MNIKHKTKWEIDKSLKHGKGFVYIHRFWHFHDKGLNKGLNPLEERLMINPKDLNKYVN